MAECSFSYVLAPHIPQLWHKHAIAQAALRDLLTQSWRVGILHTASLSPSLAFECLCPSTGTSCIRVPHIQDRLPALWDKDQLSNKLTISSLIHDWSCSSKAQELKSSTTITIGQNSGFREQKGCCVFSSTQWKDSLFLAYKLFPYQGRSGEGAENLA